MGLKQELSDSRLSATPCHHLPQEVCSVAPEWVSFCHLRAASDDGTWLKIQRLWRPRLGLGSEGEWGEGVQPHCLSRPPLTAGKSPIQKIWPGPFSVCMGGWSFGFTYPKDFPRCSGLFFSGWVEGGQRSAEALPLAHPQGVDSQPAPEILKWPLALRRENQDAWVFLGPDPTLMCNRAA